LDAGSRGELDLLSRVADMAIKPVAIPGQNSQKRVSQVAFQDPLI
jgi:hypothetical protein